MTLTPWYLTVHLVSQAPIVDHIKKNKTDGGTATWQLVSEYFQCAKMMSVIKEQKLRQIVFIRL